ncbi:hypothetical protein EDB87DRAFT_1575851 [Lactarius vividus]|nr:hypothetical protein EDB87DRAFT_1575851 [Lactarius vividus]
MEMEIKAGKVPKTEIEGVAVWKFQTSSTSPLSPLSSPWVHVSSVIVSGANPQSPKSSGVHSTETETEGSILKGGGHDGDDMLGWFAPQGLDRARQHSITQTSRFPVPLCDSYKGLLMAAHAAQPIASLSERPRYVTTPTTYNVTLSTGCQWGANKPHTAEMGRGQRNAAAPQWATQLFVHIFAFGVPILHACVCILRARRFEPRIEDKKFEKTQAFRSRVVLIMEIDKEFEPITRKNFELAKYAWKRSTHLCRTTGLQDYFLSLDLFKQAQTTDR